MFLHLCVILFTGGGLCPEGEGSLSRREFLSRGESLSGGGGSLCPGGSLSRGSLSRGQGVSVRGSLSGGQGVSVQLGLCPGEFCQGEPPPPLTVKCVRYAILECILVQ